MAKNRGRYKGLTAAEVIRRDIRRLEKELEADQRHADSICSDPMNACPGDFREDFDRNMMAKCRRLTALRLAYVDAWTMR